MMKNVENLKGIGKRYFVGLMKNNYISECVFNQLLQQALMTNKTNEIVAIILAFSPYFAFQFLPISSGVQFFLRPIV